MKNAANGGGKIRILILILKLIIKRCLIVLFTSLPPRKTDKSDKYLSIKWVKVHIHTFVIILLFDILLIDYRNKLLKFLVLSEILIAYTHTKDI